MTNSPIFDSDDDALEGAIVVKDHYGLAIPENFPSKFEEQHIVKLMNDNAVAANVEPLSIYVAWKQLERMAGLGIDQMKDLAAEQVRKDVIKMYRGTKVSMRAAGGGYEYPPDVEAVRQDLLDQIRDLKERLSIVESEAKKTGKVKKIPGRQGLTIIFREL